MANKYDASSLKVLKGLEAVRKRPGMYIGSTDTNGLHHLVWEVVDNAIDEVLGGFANSVKVRLKKDGSIMVEDNGRGIPVDKHSSGKSGIELIFTELHAGGKFGSSSSAYKVSGGLNGVGASVVNALSSKLEATVYKSGAEYFTSFKEGGFIDKKTKKVGTTKKKGTRIQFWPLKSIFKELSFNFARISERLRESTFLISGLEVDFLSEIDGKHEVYKSKDGLKEFIDFINESKSKVTKSYSFKGKSDKIEVDIAFQYTNSYSETIISFVNNIKTKNGGTHETALKNAWTKVVNDFAREQGLLKSKDPKLDGSDIREGLTSIVSVKVPESILGFVGQTKDALRTPEAKTAVEKLLYKELRFWLMEHKTESTKIISKSIAAANARLAARKARKDARATKKKLSEKTILSGKLTPAQSKIPAEKELFLVEGDSAGGSAKLGRNSKFQAILPLRGKVINTEKAKLVDILKNEEIGTMITTIGAGIGNDFQLKDVQYGKVVIMTDADTDGAHIQTLLLTFLFRYMRPLVEAGMVYIAMPPLYKLTRRTDKKLIEKYAWEDEELREFLAKHKNTTIQRYKGLGEMNADQLWETTMDPRTRLLIQVNVEDSAIVERRVSVLMGDNVKPRKQWINDNVEFSLEDDFEFIQEK